MRACRLLVTLVAALLLAEPQPSHAHAQPGFTFDYRGPTKIVGSSSVSYTAPLEFRNAANSSRFIKSATISRATVGGLLRARIFSPWGLAATAAVTAAGWAIDELQQQVLMPPPSTVSTQSGYMYYSRDSAALYPTPTAVAEAEYAGSCTEYYVLKAGPYSETAQKGYIYCEHVNNPSNRATLGTYRRVLANACPQGYDPSTDGQSCVLTDPSLAQPTPATDDDLAIVFDTLKPTQKLDLFYDPVTGQPNAIPEEAPIHDQLEQDWVSQTDSDPSTVPSEQIETIEARDFEEAQERQDETFNPPTQPQYEQQLEVPDKRDLTGVLDRAKANLDGFASQITLNATAGACSIDIPVHLPGASSTGTLDFCTWSSALLEIGQILLMLSYLAAGIIVMRA